MFTMNTAKWEFANNGRKPRGFGNWAFTFDGTTERFAFRGTFAEAKRAARAEAARRGTRTAALET